MKTIVVGAAVIIVMIPRQISHHRIIIYHHQTVDRNADMNKVKVKLGIRYWTVMGIALCLSVIFGYHMAAIHAQLWEIFIGGIFLGMAASSIGRAWEREAAKNRTLDNEDKEE
jgi:hypothetical protein